MIPAQLLLEDGKFFNGFSFGYSKGQDGEVVFNTGMVGYPESLTDPSYLGQILVFTYPLIGNYGIPVQEFKNGISLAFESSKIQVRGLIVNNYSKKYNHWRAEKSLGAFLNEQKIPAITGIDTRALTKHLRERGVMLGKILIGEEIKNYNKKQTVSDIEDPNKKDLVGEATIKEPVIYGEGKKTVLCVDCGMKNNILHSLLKYDITIKRVPSKWDITQEKFDGLFISNGPGDPAMNKETIKNISWAINKKIPIFGICMGNQLLALATGAKTFKLKYGHRSQNQPSLEVDTNRCYLTSQNHGYAVNEDTLPKAWQVWFRNANDGTVEGIRHQSGRFFSVQFHPEATPGPEDTGWLFEKFIKMI